MSSTPLAGNRRTPAGVKSQQRVKDILQAGRDVFAEKGYDAATSAEIAQRAGISEATVFSYFSGKRELCARVIADWYDEIIDAFESGLPRRSRPQITKPSGSSDNQIQLSEVTP